MHADIDRIHDLSFAWDEIYAEFSHNETTFCDLSSNDEKYIYKHQNLWKMEI